MRIAIPKQLINYIRLKDNEIVLKKELPKHLKIEFEKLKKEYESSKAMFNFVDGVK